MEKTNKCGVEFICWGKFPTCKFSTDDKLCSHFDVGLCTCKEAIIDTLEKEGYSTGTISGRAIFDPKPKRKPLADGTLPLTEDELVEFEKYWTGTINKTYKMDKLYIDRRKDEIVLMVVHTNNGISIGESFIRDIKAIAYLFERFDLIGV